MEKEGLIIIGFVCITIILILRSVYFNLKGNDLIDILLGNDFKSLSNQFFLKPKIINMIFKDKIITLGKAKGSLIRTLKYKFQLDGKNHVIESELLLVEFDDFFLNFPEFTVNFIENILGIKKKILVYEIFRNGIPRFSDNEYFFQIPFLDCYRIGNYEIYCENENILYKIIRNLRNSYKINRNLGKSLDLSEKADTILSTAEKVKISKDSGTI